MKAISNLVSGVMLSALLMVGGCESFSARVPLVRAAVEVATLNVIGDDTHRAKRIVSIIDKSMTVLDVREATIEELEAVVIGEINWSDLTPQEAILARALIGSVVEELHKRVGRGSLDSDRVVQVKAVLSWVRGIASAI